MKKGVALLLSLLLTLATLGCRETRLITAPEDDPILTAMDSNKNEVTARGKIVIQPSPMIIDEFSFHARARGDDDDLDANGYLKYERTLAPETQFEVKVEARADVICLQNIGTNQVKIGVRFTYSSFPEGFAPGDEAVFAATDSGKHGEGDSASDVLEVFPGVANVYCAAGAPVLQVPVVEGDIRIRVRTDD